MGKGTPKRLFSRLTRLFFYNLVFFCPGDASQVDKQPKFVPKVRHHGVYSVSIDKLVDDEQAVHNRDFLHAPPPPPPPPPVALGRAERGGPLTEEKQFSSIF